MRLLGNLLRTSLYLTTAGTGTELLMRLAEVDNIKQALLCDVPMVQVAAVRCSAMHTSSLFNVGASQNMPLFDIYLHKDRGIACNNRPNPFDPSLCVDQYRVTRVLCILPL